MCAFTDERDAGVQAGGFQLVRCHIISIADLTVLANHHLFIQDGTIYDAASAYDCVKEYDRISHHRAFLDDNSRREHTAFNMTFDDTSMRNKAARDMCSATHMRRRSLFATCMNHPGRIVEIEGRLIVKQRHMRFPIRLNG